MHESTSGELIRQVPSKETTKIGCIGRGRPFRN